MPGLTPITASKCVPPAMLIKKVMEIQTMVICFSGMTVLSVIASRQTANMRRPTIALTNRGNDSPLIGVKDNQMSRKVSAMKQTNWDEPPLTDYTAAAISCHS